MKAISRQSVLAPTCWLGGALIAATILSTTACAQHPDSEATNQPPVTVQENQPEAEPLPRTDFLALQPFLPERLLGLNRIAIGGVSSTFMGISTTYAEATYTNEATGASLYVKLSDLVGHGPLLRLAKSGWLGFPMSRQDERGYERTIQYKGLNGFESYDAEERSGEVTILISDRYLLELDGRHVEPGQVIKALDAFDLKALAALLPTKEPITPPSTAAEPPEEIRPPSAPASSAPSEPSLEESDAVAPTFLRSRIYTP